MSDDLFNESDTHVGGSDAGYPVSDRSAKKLVRQAAIGSPREGSTDYRWQNRSTELGYVCEVFQRARLARVRLINNPSLEVVEVPWVSNIAFAKGDSVLVEWLAGNSNQPIITGLANRQSLERSQSTKRPMSDLVPVSPNPDSVRHVLERPLLASPNTPQTFITDVYHKLVNWEAHGSDGRYLQVFAQKMPSPAESNSKVPQQFARLYHQFEVSPATGAVYRQLPNSSGAMAWRIESQVVGDDLVVQFRCGDYRPGSVQDWEPHADGGITLTMTCDGALTVAAKSIEFESDAVTVNGQPIVPAAGA